MNREVEQAERHTLSNLQKRLLFTVLKIMRTWFGPTLVVWSGLAFLSWSRSRTCSTPSFSLCDSVQG